MRRNNKIFIPVCVIISAIILLGCGKDNNNAPWIEIKSSEANDIVIEQPEPEVQEEAEAEEPNEEEVNYSDVSVADEPEFEDDSDEIVEDSDGIVRTTDGKIVVDLVMFMGQSNMAGTGGDANRAPKVPENHGFEFRAISDPTRLYPIEEPFGVNENNMNAIYDMPGFKCGSLVSSFANEYYEETGIPVVAVSAAQGGTDTAYWMRPNVMNDYSERHKRALVWLESNDYHIRKQYVVWLQGESDALDDVTTEQYKQNMDNIIRPLFINGVQKVFIITPGRTIDSKDFFINIIDAQLELCKNSGYYALATTALCGVSTEYMKDIFHYNQSVLNFIGTEAAKSVAYYTNNTKEMCIYDYKHDCAFIPDGYDYPDDVEADKIDINGSGVLERY